MAKIIRKNSIDLNIEKIIEEIITREELILPGIKKKKVLELILACIEDRQLVINWARTPYKATIQKLLDLVLQEAKTKYLMQTSQLFCDGGLLGKQIKGFGCKEGGSYCWVAVDKDNNYIYHSSGIVRSTEKRGVTNNHTEQIAIILGLESLPKGLSFEICTDSRTALLRVKSDYEISRGISRVPTTENGLPRNISERSKLAVKKFENLTFKLFQGHPTDEELETGWGTRRDLPVSKWNVFCDEKCTEENKKFKENLKNAK